MKKEDLAKVNGGMYVFSDPVGAKFNEMNSKYYHGDKMLYMDKAEREYLSFIGYDAVKLIGDIGGSWGGFVVRKDGKYVDPQEAVDAFEKLKQKLKEKVVDPIYWPSLV